MLVVRVSMKYFSNYCGELLVADLSWYDFLEIGVDFIDSDHKKLLNIMQNVKHSIETENNDESVNLLISLLNEANDHFSREEKYLLEIGYPGLEKHKNYHKDLLIKVDEIKQMCEGVTIVHDVKACFDSMADFLIDDILRGDIMFKSYLEYNGHIKSI